MQGNREIQVYISCLRKNDIGSLVDVTLCVSAFTCFSGEAGDLCWNGNLIFLLLAVNYFIFPWGLAPIEQVPVLSRLPRSLLRQASVAKE